MHDVKNLFFYFLFFCYMSDLCRSYKILVVFPMPGKSHATLGKSCVRLLLEAGHQVTYLQWGLDHQPHQNLTVIDISVPIPLEARYSLKQRLNGEVDLNNMHEFSMIMSGLQRKIFEKDIIQNFLQDPNENFDVAILEWIYGEYIAGFPAIFGCPYIWFSTMEPHSMILGLIGEITNPAYTSMNVFNRIPPFSFLDRVTSLKDQLSMYMFREFYKQSVEEQDYERVVASLIAKRQSVVPAYNELRYNASLILGNSHISVGRPVHLPQAYKAIGGYHLEKKLEPLSKDLKMLMDSSTDGVIYFSLGSIFNSKDLPVETIQKLLKIFSGLKQTILWKFEENLLNKPKNVYILSWVPQQNILAHPNCILFISHGGQLSMLEAVHYGAPLIGIPVFVDQHTNVKTLASKGMAIEVDIYNLSENMEAAIEEILGDSSYAQAAKIQSLVYHHRPATPGTEMVHWVEHVVLTNGGPHLRSVALMVPWYQKCYLDVLIVVIVAIVLLTVAVQRLLSTFNRLRRADVKKVQ